MPTIFLQVDHAEGKVSQVQRWYEADENNKTALVMTTHDCMHDGNSAMH